MSAGTGTRTIRIVAADREVTAELDDTPTAAAFAALLPLDVTLADFHDTEKVADLPEALATDEAPDGYEPSAGDLAYYAPWGTSPSSTATSGGPPAWCGSGGSSPAMTTCGTSRGRPRSRWPAPDRAERGGTSEGFSPDMHERRSLGSSSPGDVVCHETPRGLLSSGA
jgi:hypothetical protein